MSKKLDGISWLNLMFCMMVMLIHSTSEFYYTGRETGIFFGFIFALRRLSSCAVYGFVFLSGMKLCLRPREKWSAFYFGRLRRVVIPYIIWTCIYYAVYCVYGRYSFSLNELACFIATGEVSAQLYFIVVIVQFYALMPLWTGSVRRIAPAALIAAAAAVTVLSQRYINDLVGLIVPGFSSGDRMFTSYLVFWIAGCVCGVRSESFFSAVKRYKTLLLIFCMVTGAINCIGAYAAEILTKSVPLGNELHLLYSLTAIVVGLALFDGVRMPKLLRRINPATYGIFLMHCLVMYFVRYYMDAAGVESPLLRLAAIVLGVYGITIFVCTAFASIVRRK